MLKKDARQVDLFNKMILIVSLILLGIALLVYVFLSKETAFPMWFGALLAMFYFSIRFFFSNKPQKLKKIDREILIYSGLFTLITGIIALFFGSIVTGIINIFSAVAVIVLIKRMQ